MSSAVTGRRNRPDYANEPNLVGTDGNAPRALTSLPSGTDLQAAVVGNPLKTRYRTPGSSTGRLRIRFAATLLKIWRRGRESNPPESDRQSDALPRGLPRQNWYTIRELNSGFPVKSRILYH